MGVAPQPERIRVRGVSRKFDCHGLTVPATGYNDRMAPTSKKAPRKTAVKRSTAKAEPNPDLTPEDAESLNNAVANAGPPVDEAAIEAASPPAADHPITSPEAAPS